MSASPLVVDLDAIVERGEAYFRQLAGERIFLTGGTGFFGQWLLEALTHADARLGLKLRVTVLSRDPEAFARRAPRLAAAPALSWWRGDVRDFASPPGQYTYVIHAATAASEALNRNEPRKMFDTIVDGTHRVLDFAAGAGTRALLLTSSGAVYGRQPPDLARLDETYGGGPDPSSPSSAYAEGKRAAEFLAATSGVPVKIARCFAFVGPHMSFDTHFAVGNFIRDACARQTISISGDGTPLRSYLYAADLVVWLLKILLDGKTGRPYNVGSDIPVSVEQLAHLIGELAGSYEVIVQGKQVGVPPERYIPSIERARAELNLDVWTSLPLTLQRTINWYRAVLNRP